MTALAAINRCATSVPGLITATPARTHARDGVDGRCDPRSGFIVVTLGFVAADLLVVRRRRTQRVHRAGAADRREVTVRPVGRPRPLVPVPSHVRREVGERPHPVPALPVQRLVHDDRLLGLDVLRHEDHLVLPALKCRYRPGVTSLLTRPMVPMRPSFAGVIVFVVLHRNLDRVRRSLATLDNAAARARRPLPCTPDTDTEPCPPIRHRSRDDGARVRPSHSGNSGKPMTLAADTWRVSVDGTRHPSSPFRRVLTAVAVGSRPIVRSAAGARPPRLVFPRARIACSSTAASGTAARSTCSSRSERRAVAPGSCWRTGSATHGTRRS